ncbi:nucleolar and spindle-associated protein 1 [Denticeps clupeoides]|uniref:Nucleolar and spindle-associated protein 1 n=1 Tax=Denticeps clupeoides TaxID=299321 RepID=A0AAY4DKI8_9TELE|nr:nucleolar and spindle-associated protein 1 [Denticeps clupeoides]
MDLDGMKYAELRRLAKEAGLKANLKADKLLKALKQHYQEQENQSQNGNQVTIVATNRDDSVQEQFAQKPDSFVSKRRGKGQRVKRRQHETFQSQQPTSPVQSEDEGQRRSKRRKVSLSDPSDTPVAAEPEEVQTKTQPEQEEKSADIEKEEIPKLARNTGKIPRHEGLLKNRPALRPTTPNFKKLHEAHFNKMESIDSYLHRKNTQMEVFRNSVKELKSLSKTTAVEKKAPSKPNPSRTSLFSPSVQNKGGAAEKRRPTQSSNSKCAAEENAAFKPFVLTTNRINVRFSQATQDNEHKHSLVKTPARMSLHINHTSTPGNKSITKTAVTKSGGVTSKTPGLTPFVFRGNTSVSNSPATNRKNNFDLKASLSRPLTYKPHKGKLKPFIAPKEATNLNKTEAVPSVQKNYKQHQVQTREARRVKHTEDRKQKKEKMLGARRGLVMT